MDYLSYMWDENGADYRTGFRLLKNLGVRSIRHWMHFGEYMEDWRTFRPAAVRKMHDILEGAQRYGFQVIGMNHVNWSLEEKKFCDGGNQSGDRYAGVGSGKREVTFRQRAADLCRKELYYVFD